MDPETTPSPASLSDKIVTRELVEFLGEVSELLTHEIDEGRRYQATVGLHYDGEYLHVILSRPNRHLSVEMKLNLMNGDWAERGAAFLRAFRGLGV